MTTKDLIEESVARAMKATVIPGSTKITADMVMSPELMERLARAAIAAHTAAISADSEASTPNPILLSAPDQAGINEMALQRDALAAFAREVIRTMWEGGDLDGGDVQHMAEGYGLIVPSVDPDDPPNHLTFAPWLKTISEEKSDDEPTRSIIDGARQLRELYPTPSDSEPTEASYHLSALAAFAREVIRDYFRGSSLGVATIGVERGLLSHEHAGGGYFLVPWLKSIPEKSDG